MDKFGRNYLLTVQTYEGDYITVKPPFTIDFDIQRDTLSSVNIANIRIYNLSERNRNLIRKDAWNFFDIRQLALRAGYGNQISTIAVGNISQAWSVREGTEYITSIKSFDGGLAFTQAQSNLQFPSGTTKRTIVQKLADNMTNFGVTVGAIGDIKKKIPRGNSYSGGTASILKDITGDSFFIDNGKINILGSNEAIDGSVLVINSESGLLGTPIRENTYLRFDLNKF